MTKKEVEKKIREIMDKDPLFRGTKLEMMFVDKQDKKRKKESSK